MSLDPGIRTAELIVELIESGYVNATAATVRAILRGNNTGIIARRLAELREEASRLADANKMLRSNNPVMRALFADMDDVLRNNRVLIANSGVELQESAVNAAMAINRQLALPGFSDGQLAALGVRWNTADPAIINELVGFVENPAWETQLAQYGDDVINTIRNQAITGVANGWGPVRIANAIIRQIQGLPPSEGVARVAGISETAAQNMMRTLQMQSFRTAQTINRMQNADILSGHIRIAALDDRTCLACVSLHGQKLPIDQRVDDHHQGRCTSIPEVNGRPRTVASGQEWWDGRTEAQQLAQAGPANFKALQAGAVTLPDFVQPYDDPVFGEMLRESSLKGALGSGAQEFYT
jgi:hypothetical protein